MKLKVKEEVYLYLSQFVEMADTFLAEQTTLKMTLKEFSQMIEEIMAISKEFTKRSLKSLCLSPSRSVYEKNELFVDIDDCLSIVKKDCESSNPYFRDSLTSLMGKFSDQLKHLFFVFEIVGR
jgi:hypothetical protein